MQFMGKKCHPATDGRTPDTLGSRRAPAANHIFTARSPSRALSQGCVCAPRINLIINNRSGAVCISTPACVITLFTHSLAAWENISFRVHHHALEVICAFGKRTGNSTPILINRNLRFVNITSISIYACNF